MNDLLSPLPQVFQEKLLTFLSPTEQRDVLIALSHPSVVSFRINPLKTTKEIVLSVLHDRGFIVEQLSWYPDAFMLKNKSKEELLSSLVKEGYIYIQGLSSMIPVVVMNPQPDEVILDMAAAPGSKTTQIASFMRNTGELTANDKSRERLYKLRPLLENLGVTNAKVISVSGEYLWKKLPEYFDKVLLDAPCSMEGRFLSTDRKSYEDWSPKKVKMLSNIQKYLLRSAISCTKVGGVIVYSTCTLSPEENEEVIDWILEREREHVELEEIVLPGFEGMNGLTTWKKKVFDKSIAKTIRLLPSENYEGFYVAKFKKVKSNILSGLK